MKMTDSEFEALAMKELGGEATSEESLCLQEILETDHARAAEYQDLKESLEILQASLPLTTALEHSKGSPQLPAWREQELQAAVRKEFPRKQKSSGSATIWHWLFQPQAFAWGVALVALICVGALEPWAEPRIIFGMYEPYSTRLTQPEVPVAGLPGIDGIRSFDEDNSFNQWKQRSFGKPGIHIWFDEENNLLRVRRISPFGSEDSNYPLPEADSKRREAVKQLLEELQR